MPASPSKLPSLFLSFLLLISTNTISCTAAVDVDALNSTIHKKFGGAMQQISLHEWLSFCPAHKGLVFPQGVAVHESYLVWQESSCRRCYLGNLELYEDNDQFPMVLEIDPFNPPIGVPAHFTFPMVIKTPLALAELMVEHCWNIDTIKVTDPTLTLCDCDDEDRNTKAPCVNKTSVPTQAPSPSPSLRASASPTSSPTFSDDKSKSRGNLRGRKDHKVTAAEDEKVVICHGTSSDTNPYTMITVSEEAAKTHLGHKHNKNKKYHDALPGDEVEVKGSKSVLDEMCNLVAVTPKAPTHRIQSPQEWLCAC